MGKRNEGWEEGIKFLKKFPQRKMAVIPRQKLDENLGFAAPR